MQQKLGKYEIKRELGRGAMGVVYEAFDPFIQRTVAIKTILKSLFDKADLSDVLSRFRREAQAAGRLNHPGIVAIYEYGEEGDVAYIAMEYVTGTELKDRFEHHDSISIRESADIVLQLLDALEYSHGRGVVHRDIKPSNIMITREGRVKVADFGIARIESSELTQVGSVLGTPSYMAPEQFMGEHADRRSDLYSAGVVLYQLLTGKRPFTGDSMPIIMRKTLNEEPVPPSRCNPAVGKALDEVVKKAMAKRADERFQSAAAFATALRLAAEVHAEAERQARPEATLRVAGAEQAANPRPAAPAQQDSNWAQALITPNASFQAAFKQHEEELARLRQQQAAAAAPQEEIERFEKTEVIAPPPKAESSAPAQPVAPAPAQHAAPASSLLAGLEREAHEKAGSRHSADALQQSWETRCHEALDAIIKYFTAFNKSVNSVAPEINRMYNLDARSVFSHLKWQHAKLDARRRDLTDSAPYVRASFSVRLCAPEPVLLKRPWSQLDVTRRELDYLKLSIVEDWYEISRRPKQEWLEAHLAPDFPVVVSFAANNERSRIDVTTTNLGAFGPAAFHLQPEEVNAAMLDELGLYLLGRSNKLPAAWRRA